MFKLGIFGGLLVMGLVAQSVPAVPAKSGKYFSRAIFVIFENTDYGDAIRQPFFKRLANLGVNFTNFRAVTHPSQGNYVALTSGSLHGVRGDRLADLKASNIADSLEEKGLTWKVYAEDYPGGCATGAFYGNYARKHNPFISYVSIATNPARCANIVNAEQFDRDVAAGTLPNYSFYVPNLKDDGHDTGVEYADNWYARTFARYLSDAHFLKDTVLITTFDESGGNSTNQIYTSIVGSPVKPGDNATSLNTYSLINLIEDNWTLGNLGTLDLTAPSVPEEIWKF